MTRTTRIHCLATAILSFLPAVGRSQSCFGTAPFTEGPVRAGVSRVRPKNADVRSGHIALGELGGVFMDASYSRIKPLSGPETELRGHEYGVAAGFDWRVWRTKGLYFCPTLEVRRGQRNSVFLASRLPSGELTNDRFLTLGGALGPSSGVHDGVVISPTAGAWFARDRAAATAGAPASTRDYGVLRFGIGFVILKRYSASALYAREFGTPAALPGYAVLSASVDIGK